MIYRNVGKFSLKDTAYHPKILAQRHGFSSQNSRSKTQLLIQKFSLKDTASYPKILAQRHSFSSQNL
jgi:hypothetical protein